MALAPDVGLANKTSPLLPKDKLGCESTRPYLYPLHPYRYGLGRC